MKLILKPENPKGYWTEGNDHAISSWQLERVSYDIKQHMMLNDKSWPSTWINLTTCDWFISNNYVVIETNFGAKLMKITNPQSV